MPDLSDIQRLVVAQTRRDLLVSAGAGSGKTTVLVESVLASLRAGVALDRILVVTFTEKAAAEMKGRIYEALARDEALAPLRLQLPLAWISTIHSFCLRILREHFDRAGLDPRFRVLSEEDARILLSDAMDRVFREGYDALWGEKENDAFEELVEMCGFDRTGERLRGVVADLLRYARTSEDADRFLADHLRKLDNLPATWDALAWTHGYAARADRAWQTLLGLLDALCEEIRLVAKPGKDAEFVALRDALHAIPVSRLRTPAGQPEVAAAIAALRGEDGAIDLPTLPSGTRPHVAKLRDALKSVLASPWLTEIPIGPDAALADERATERLGRTLVRMTQRIAQVYDEAKGRAGALDFDDLQIRALRLIDALSDGAAPLRFERVFIDEYQDVNALQDRILSRVASPTSMFRVGDLKQCIYQFRLSNPEIMRGLGLERPLVRDAGDPPDGAEAWNVLLPDNYRSLEPILGVVNEVGRALFLPAEIGTRYEEQSLVRGGEAQVDAPEVELVLIREAPETPRSPDEFERPEEGEEEGEGDPQVDDEDRPDLREAQWEEIARTIRELVDGGALVRDPATRTQRAVGYADIAVLLRAGASAPALARRLEEWGVPCSLAAEASFFEAREVQDLLSVLHAADNLLDDIALAAALRSPAFGWADAELYALRLQFPRAVHLAYALAGSAGRNDAIVERADPGALDLLRGRAVRLPDTPPFDTLPERSARAIGCFERWRAAAGTVELPDLLAQILRETALAEAVASLPNGLRRQANLRKFLGLARRFAEESGQNLHRFLRWLTALQEEGARIPQAPVASESVPAVRILTVHAAKGLEFPVVILAEMGRAFQFTRQSKALIPGREFLGVRIFEREAYRVRMPIPLRLLRDERIVEGLAEEKRVLYVALTRARDRLILTGSHTAWTAPAPELRRAYASLQRCEDASGPAGAQELLRRKRTPLAWILYALPQIPDPPEVHDPAARAVEGLPLTVRWVTARAQAKLEPAATPVRLHEPALRALAPVPWPPPEDTQADEALGRASARGPAPLPGLLAQAAGKIWATDLKSERDRDRFARWRREAAEEATPDEPDVPLLAPAEAAAQGIVLHALLERLDTRGLTHENLDARLADAAAHTAGFTEDLATVARAAISRLLTLPLGRALTAGDELHREVAFSLRIPMLELARWVPSLREELLASPDWEDWIDAAPGGGLAIRPDRAAAAGEPWVLVQGRIDAILRDGDTWWVLDWKSDRIASDADLAEAVARYDGQIAIYRRAVERLFGKPVRAALYFLRPGILREIGAAGA